ncbi:MAG: glycosyltransferase family 10 domain-containing protein [Sulfitobacter sp.]
MMFEPAIAVLPYMGARLGAKLATLPLDELHWPLGCPARLKGGVVGDLTLNDHLIVYPRNAMHFQLNWGTRAKVSVMVAEPAMIHGRHLKLLRWTYRRFYKVLSYDEALLAAIPNGIRHPFGASWVPHDAGEKATKTQHMSLIASAKRDSAGHLLRHEMVDFVQAQGLDVAVLGRGYAPFEKKEDGLAPYRFSIVIENIRESNYFTEKIVDAVLCETVPIYWGCPNIGDYFDPACMLVCENADQMKAAIVAATDAQYDAMVPALRAAKSQAAHWGDLEGRAAKAIQASL